MFLNELEEILDVIEPAEFQKVLSPPYTERERLKDHCSGHGAPVQPVDQVRQQPSFPGELCKNVLLSRKSFQSLFIFRWQRGRSTTGTMSK